MKSFEVIKMVATNRYEIAIVKDVDDMYTITYHVVSPQGFTSLLEASEPISDYSMATSLFDMKIQDLEGN